MQQKEDEGVADEVEGWFYTGAADVGALIVLF